MAVDWWGQLSPRPSNNSRETGTTILFDLYNNYPLLISIVFSASSSLISITTSIPSSNL